MPQNCLLLEHKAHLAFRLFKWTLVATEVRLERLGLASGAKLMFCLTTPIADPEQVQDPHLCVSGAMPRDRTY